MTIDREDLKRLIDPGNGPHVSIFLPTHRRGPATRQDPIRLKNRIRDAERQATEAGRDRAVAERVLAPAVDLLADREFWQHRTDGLALFLREGRMHRQDLPFPCEERTVVSDRFHVKPIIPLLYRGSRFHLLTLSQNRSELWDCGTWGMSRRSVDLPSLDEALRFDVAESQLQFHTGTGGAADRRASMFHGHGVGTDDEGDRLERFVREIDRLVCEALPDDAVPLVLAAVGHLHPIYREASRYRALIDRGIHGNPEDLGRERLLREARQRVEPWFDSARQEALGRFAELDGAGSSRAATRLETIVPAAVHGRIDRLFVSLDACRWGTYDPPADRLVEHEHRAPGDDDLLDLAVSHTFLRGGEAWALPSDRVPGSGDAAAVLRY